MARVRGQEGEVELTIMPCLTTKIYIICARV